VAGVEQQHHGRHQLVVTEPGREQVGGQVLPGRATPVGEVLTHQPGELHRRTHGCVDDLSGGLGLVHPDDRLRPAAQGRDIGTGEADQLGDHQDGQRLGVLPEHVETARVHLVEQRGGERLDARAQPFDVAAVERAGHCSTQPGVLGGLVLHHLVAVQQVERLEVVGGLAVVPDPAELAVAQHGPGSSVGERQPAAAGLVPGDLVPLALCGELRVGVRHDVGGAEVNRGRGDRRHRAAPRPCVVRRTP
jgi:hypothetical protein